MAATNMLYEVDSGSYSEEEVATPVEYLLQTAAISKKIFAFVEASFDKKEHNFYESPRLRQYWGEEEEEFESWKELFFDLIYVAMAVKLGNVIEQDLSEPRLFFYFFGQFCPMYAMWHSRTIFLSQFRQNSYFHVIIDVFHALSVAFMALFIGSRAQILIGIGEQEIASSSENSTAFFQNSIPFLIDTPTVNSSINNFNTLFAFSGSFLACQLIEIVRCLEMKFVIPYSGVNKSEDDEKILEQQKAIRSTANTCLAKHILSICFTIVGIIGTLIGKIELTLFCLFSAFFASVFFHLIERFYFKYYSSKKFYEVPINVNFVVRRMGELTMLLLGEGILQIILITAIADNLTAHLEVFTLSFFILTFMHYIAFYVLPTEAENHAFKGSSPRALLINLTIPFSNGALIFLAVSLKLFLKQETLAEGANPPDELPLIFTESLAIGTMCLIFQKFVHTGHHKLFRKDDSPEGRRDNSWSNFNFKRILYSIFYLASPCSFFILLPTTGLISLSGTIAIQVGVIFLGRIEDVFFNEELKKEKEKAISLLSLEPDHYVISSAAPITQGNGGHMPNCRSREQLFSKLHLSSLLNFLKRQTIDSNDVLNNSGDIIENEKVLRDLLKKANEIEEVAKMIKSYVQRVNDALLENDAQPATL